jgi:hypothetical protein
LLTLSENARARTCLPYDAKNIRILASFVGFWRAHPPVWRYMDGMRTALILTLGFFGCSTSTGTSSGFSDTTSGGAGSSGSSGTFGGGGDGGGGKQCNPNPEAAEVPGNSCDDDADGMVDNVEACDSSLAVNGPAAAFAKAVDMCHDAKGGASWGVVRAEYRSGYNTTNGTNPDQFGILPKFGNVLKPRGGRSLGVLSTGFGREYDALSGTISFNQGEKSFGLFIGGVEMHGASTPPPGFPKATVGCPAATNEINDAAVFHVELKAPINATGFAFDFNFHTSEWPRYLCTTFNDAFVAFVTREDGTKENVSFDSAKNPVNVNLGFFDRCTPGVQTTCSPGSSPKVSTCPGGPGELAGTGFGRVSSESGPGSDEFAYCKDNSTGGGATGWLETQAPIKPGEKFSIDFMIWDAGDTIYDSSVLVDNFRWLVGNVTGTTQRPN